MELESGRAGELVDRSTHSPPARLGYRPALLAHEEHRAVPFTGPAARYVGVAARDTVNESKALEERESAVYLSGGRPPALPVEPIQDLVSPYRVMLGEQELEHRPPIRGEALVPLPADILRAGEASGNAGGVVMPPLRER